MHVFQSRFLRRGEVWFDEEPDQTPVDWIYYRQRPNRIPGAKWTHYYTLLVDLRNSPEALLESFNKSTRYNTRRARDVDKFVCESPSPPEMLDTFAQVYRRFARLKKLGALNRRRLEQLAKEGCLDVSLARDLKGTPLVYHVYYRGINRSCLMHSVSLHDDIADSHARNAMARANCLLTWCDMLRHKEQGLTRFDFGGWYTGNKDQARLGINRFKTGFGGNVVCENNGTQILTLKGRVVLTIAALLERGKTLARKSKSAPPKHTEPTQQVKTDATQPRQNAVSSAV